MRGLLVLAMLVPLAACPPVDGGPDAGPSDAGPSELGAADYCESIAPFFCAFYLRCGRMAVADEAACRPVFLEACNARFEPTYASLEGAGLLSLSAEGIETCRAHLDDVACDQQQLELQGPCAGMWIGTQGAGEPCGFDVETFTCAPGSLCVLDLSLCGTCESVLADGAACGADGVTCGAESFCARSGTCTARRRAGETCGVDDRCVLGTACTDGVCVGPSYVGVGDACSFDARCPYASRCIGGTCRATAPLGAGCDTLAVCDSGWCDTSSGTGVCTALIAQGAACSDDDQCQTGACGDDGACVSVPSICFGAP